MDFGARDEEGYTISGGDCVLPPHNVREEVWRKNCGLRKFWGKPFCGEAQKAHGISFCIVDNPQALAGGT